MLFFGASSDGLYLGQWFAVACDRDFAASTNGPEHRFSAPGEVCQRCIHAFKIRILHILASAFWTTITSSFGQWKLARYSGWRNGSRAAGVKMRKWSQ